VTNAGRARFSSRQTPRHQLSISEGMWHPYGPDISYFSASDCV
jgi:hypothetical protein